MIQSQRLIFAVNVTVTNQMQKKIGLANSRYSCNYLQPSDRIWPDWALWHVALWLRNCGISSMWQVQPSPVIFCAVVHIWAHCCYFQVSSCWSLYSSYQCIGSMYVWYIYGMVMYLRRAKCNEQVSSTNIWKLNLPKQHPLQMPFSATQ